MQEFGEVIIYELLLTFSLSPQVSQTHDSRNRSNINDLCTRIEWGVTALSAQCYVTQWASTRHSMEFEITKDKIVQWNKMFSNKTKTICSPCLVSVVHLAYFIVFGVFWCLSQLSVENWKAHKTTKQAKWTTETRQGEYNIFLVLFKKVTFYFTVRFYPSLF